jgi:hypothetical protein
MIANIHSITKHKDGTSIVVVKMIYSSMSSPVFYIFKQENRKFLRIETSNNEHYVEEHVRCLANDNYSKFDPANGHVEHCDSKYVMHNIFIQAVHDELNRVLVGFFEDDYTPPNYTRAIELESAETLKCKCYYCQVHLNVFQSYRFEDSKYSSSTTCHKCGRKDSVVLTAEQIKQCNAQGGYQMNMGK